MLLVCAALLHCSPGLWAANPYTVNDNTTLEGVASAKAAGYDSVVFTTANLATISTTPIAFDGPWVFNTNVLSPTEPKSTTRTPMFSAPKVDLKGVTLQITGKAIEEIDATKTVYSLFAYNTLENGSVNVVDWDGTQKTIATAGGVYMPYNFLDLILSQETNATTGVHRVNMTQQLAWNRKTTEAHGDFLIDENKMFTVRAVLSDQKLSGGTGTNGTKLEDYEWDGKTLDKWGDGTLELAAANTYTGWTNVNEGFLRLTAADAIAKSAGLLIEEDAVVYADGNQTLRSLDGEGELRYGHGSVGTLGTLTLDIDANELADFEGTINGWGNFVKKGDGTLILENEENLLKGTTEKNTAEVREGTLLFSGYLGETTTVFSGAVLGGTGNWPDLFSNAEYGDFVFKQGSVHAPGYGGPDYFYGNNFKYEKGSTILMEVGKDADGDLVYDRIVAAGTIDLAAGGGSMQLNIGNYRESLDEDDDALEIDIFDAEGGMSINGENIKDAIESAKSSGTLSLKNKKGDEFLITLDKSLDLTGWELESFGGEQILYLTLTPNGNIYRFNRNQSAVYEALDDGELLDEADYYYGEERGAFLDNLIPYVDSTLPIVSRHAIARFTGNISQRLEMLAYHAASGCARKDSQLWVSLDGEILNRKTRHGVTGYELKAGSGQFGIETVVLRDVILGVSAGGGRSDVKMKDSNQGKAETDHFTAAVYGIWFQKNWSLKTTAGYGWNRYKTTRHITAGGITDSTRGKHDGNAFFAGFEYARRLQFGQTTLAPYYSFDYVGLWENSYEETGSVNGMAFDKRTTHGYLQTIGVRLEREIFCSNGMVIRPTLYGGWVHDYGDGSIRSNGAIIDGSDSFIVYGASTVPNRAKIGIGLDIKPWENWFLFGRYEGEFADHFDAQYGTVGLGFVW